MISRFGERRATDGIDVTSELDGEGRLRAYIEGARARGDLRLPSEPTLADRIGVTRARLRGILKRLEGEGLIWRHVGKGTFVGERSLTAELPTLHEMLNPIEAFEARMVLEPQLAGLAALRATARQIEEMRECCRTMEAVSHFPDWAVWDERLHRLIARAAANKLLLALYDAVRESAPTGMRERLHDVFAKEPNAETNSEHRAFVDAIGGRDAGRAEAAMRHHLQSVRRSLFGDR
ncbi:MAG: FCD domain-containing protein [Sphingomonas fennica]